MRTAYEFDGVDDYITASITAVTTEFLTILAWVRADGNGEANVGKIVEVGSADTAAAFRQVLDLDTPGQIRMLVRHATTNASTLSVDNTLTYPAGWKLVVGTFDPADSKCRVYLGDESTAAAELSYASQVTAAGARSGGSTFACIGNNASVATNTFDGGIGPVAIFARALTSDEIEYFRLHGSPESLTSCRAFWPFYEDALDDSGNGANGTVIGATLVAGPSFHLIVADATHAQVADNLTLTQVHALAVADATHAHGADALTLTQAHELVTQEALHAHAADSPSLTQAHDLAVAEALHGHGADNLDLTQLHLLAVADALHAHTADGLTLTQLHELAVQDGLHAHAAEAVVLTQLHVLGPADALHGHEADSPTLTQAHLLAVAAALHGHAAEVVALVQQHGLAVAGALHAHFADAVVLTQAHLLVVADGLHGHTADGLSLTQVHVLVVAEALHGHSADQPALVQLHLLVVADALHAHTADSVVLVAAALPFPLVAMLLLAAAPTARVELAPAPTARLLVAPAPSAVLSVAPSPSARLVVAVAPSARVTLDPTMSVLPLNDVLAIKRGDDATLLIRDALNTAGTPFDWAASPGIVVTWTLRRQEGDSAHLAKRTNAAGDGITLGVAGEGSIDLRGDGPAGEVRDTSVAGAHWWDLQVRTTSGDVHTLRTGELIIEQDVSRP